MRGGLSSWKERSEGYKKDRDGKSAIQFDVSLLLQKGICFSVCMPLCVCMWGGGWGLLRKSSRHLTLT